MESRYTSVSLAWFLLLALFLHAGLSRLHLPHGAQTSIFGGKSAPKEKQYVIERAPEENKDKPVVETSRARHDESADDQKAKYAGEFRNRVKKETQAQRRGKFSEHTIVQQHHGGEIERGTDNGIGEPLEKEGRPSPSPADGLAMRDLMAFAASPNALDKDVDEGDETVLNTDSVLYASFINRISEEIYDPWVAHVHDAVEGYLMVGRKIPPKTYFTRLNVLMDGSGTVTAITVVESSGLPELDEAAKKAFWEREPFRNPPEQMLGKDGLMKLVYGFRFDYRTSFFNVSPWST